MKDRRTVVGPYDDGAHPARLHEDRLGGRARRRHRRRARYLESPDEAAALIAGYAISHDVSERTFQLERGGQWDKGKSCETFNPFGPDLVTRRRGRQTCRTRAAARVNGELRQDGSTADMIFGVAPPDLVPQPVHGAASPATSSTPVRRPVSRWAAGEPYLRAGDVVEL